MGEDVVIILLGIELLVEIILIFLRNITEDNSLNKWVAIIGVVFILLDIITIPGIITPNR